MSLYRDASIEQKLTLVMLTTSLLGLSVACFGFEIYERMSYRESITSELTSLADTLGANTTASLAFNDHQSAVDILSALRAERHVVEACLYDKHGKFFADYKREPGVDHCSESATHAEVKFGAESVTLSQRISLGGEMAGSIVLISDLDALHAKIRRYTEIAALVIFLSVLATLLVASRLIRLITRPILQLAKIAGRVSAKEDYTLRAVAGSADEVGMLVTAFNQMPVSYTHLDVYKRQDFRLGGVNRSSFTLSAGATANKEHRGASGNDDTHIATGRKRGRVH